MAEQVKRRSAKAHPALVLKERERLREILNDPIFVKAIERAANYKPGAFCAGIGSQINDPAASQLIANNRLHEIRGWELFERALYLQAEDPKPQKTKLEETYPDTGRIDYEW